MDKTELPYAVLLKSGHGYKEEMTDELTPVVVSKGSLLTYLDSLISNRIKQKYDCLVNYKLVDTCYHSEVFFFATEPSVFYITNLQKDLLLGIEHMEDRTKVLDKLQWVESLTVGSEVCITIATVPTPVRGIIRYIGELHSEEGRNFKVELMERKDGIRRNQECDKDCTVVVAMDKLTRGKNIQSAKVTKTTASKSTSVDHCSFVVSDHVMFYDKHKNIFRGIIQSVGPSYVGIQVEVDVCLADFPRCINSHKDKSSTIFLPVCSVRRDTTKSRRILSCEDNVFSPSGDVYLLTKENKNVKNSQDLNVVQGMGGQSSDDSCRGSFLTSSSVELIDANPYNLEVGSAVQYGKPAQCGIIKWMGNLSNEAEVLAEVEMDESAEGMAQDGVWKGTRYFDCAANRGLFVPLMELKPNDKVKKLSADNILLPSADSPSIATNHGNQNPCKFQKGSKVQCGCPVKYGVIKWIGMLPPENEWLYAGVEMENTVDNCTDGMFQGIQYFVSQPGKGKFVKVLELQPDERFPMDTTMVGSKHSFEVGSMVQFGDPKEYGKVTWIGCPPDEDEEFARVLAEDGKRNGLIPITTLQLDVRHTDGPVNLNEHKSHCVDLISSHCQEDAAAGFLENGIKSQQVLTELDIGSMVQFGDPVNYGVIKRIEALAGVTSAEIEMDNGKCKMLPLSKIQPDKRFCVDVNNIEGQVNPLEKEHYRHDEKAPYIPPDRELDKHKHMCTKGIQGYKNSCYLDATLYGMFAFSDAFDVLLREEITINNNELRLQNVLKSDIIYPLRKKGIVIQDAIEEFRGQLAKLQDEKGLVSEEKDPEEFLNILFKHVLRLDPFVIIKRPSGIDKEFLIQLFVEPDEDKCTVSTQKLLNKMFKEQNISFVKPPTRLLLQMPRYGKRFKSFQHIVPSLELDITPLCHTTGPWSACERQDGYDHEHNLSNLHHTGTLQLLSVLCIETSHYVCFTRITGSGKDEWVFFDSMAERQDTGYNLPKVTHCTDPLKKFVYGKKDISKISSKQLPELARRFVQDVYLCIYVRPDKIEEDGAI